MNVEALANSIALNLNNHPVRLGDLWKEQPIVLVFVRHDG